MPAGDDLVEVGRSVIAAGPAGRPEVQVDIKYVVFWEAGKMVSGSGMSISGI